MRGIIIIMKEMTVNSTIDIYNELDVENRSLVDDFIQMIFKRQKNSAETLKVIKDADNGIGLSKAYDNVDDLMEALNAED